MVFSSFLDFLNHQRIEYVLDVKTADLVSFKIGGVGKIAVYPSNIEDFVGIIRYVGKEKFVIVGNGTNCYFTDDFYNGIIIVTKRLNKVRVFDNSIIAECGTSLVKLCNMALEESLSGLEFAYGIPGSLGGAINMNASAFGGEFSQIVQKSTVIDIESGEIAYLTNKDHCFWKKHSVFKRGRLLVLESELVLNKSEKSLIHSKMREYMNKRIKTQPLDLPNAGSTFVRPKEGYASYLIDKAGLKGYAVGGAQVSNKHAGFIVNVNNASAKDVKELIRIIKARIFDNFGIELNEEIIYIE